MEQINEIKDSIKFSAKNMQEKLNEIKISNSDRDDLIGWIKYIQFKINYLEFILKEVKEQESTPQPTRTVYAIE
jgi:hypothetical protein